MRAALALARSGATEPALELYAQFDLCSQPGEDTRALGARFRDGRLAWSRLWQFAVLGHWLDGARQRLAA